MNVTTMPNKSSRHQKREEKAAKKAAESGHWSASNTNIHELYQLSVQNVEAEIDFIDETFETLRNRKAISLREDFCGTGNTSAEWVRRRESNNAIGIDLDQPTLDYGHEVHVKTLDEGTQSRIALLNRNVLDPGADASGVDCVLAMNFSYWLFKTRDDLRNYFKIVRDSLGPDGVFFLDHYGGSEAMVESKEAKKIDNGPGRTFTYIWEQKHFNPITGDMECRIHFKFPDKTKIKDAFIYQWRLWSLPELRELLSEAGFSNVHVYWEGEDEEDEGEGNGEYEATLEGTADPAFISYIVAYD
ncbi:MAG: class I SAM-dependent methyltransferase [Phycisphaerales bacterium]|nr:class I SAM-dependent methyltransferase [Phycisphaerales bacterium]